MINETINAKGTVQFTLTDENGAVKQEITVPNLVVTTGLAYIASRMRDATAAIMSHMAVGTSSAVAATTDTSAIAEIGRAALSSAVVATTTVAGDSTVYNATFGPGVGTGAIVEAAILNAVSGGTMLCRTVFPVVNKSALDTLAITWKVTLA